MAESPHVQPCVWEYIAANEIPVLGICYGMQEIAHVFGGAVQPSTEREFGRALIDVTQENADSANVLFAGVDHSQMWMSHGGIQCIYELILNHFD
jgi:GMP synthase (glutamine-hydrolysing)